MFDKKILCLGDNSELTDQMVSELAHQSRTRNHGLVSDSKFKPVASGYYHTTVVDLIPGEIVKLADQFDAVMLLDQDPESWTDPLLYSATQHLLKRLEEKNKTVLFQNNKHEKDTSTSFFRSLLETNKSFCIYPWIQLLSRDNENTLLCSKSFIPFTKLNEVKDWQTDPAYSELRNKMIAGEMFPDYCDDCYKIESTGGESQRIFDTILWATKLGLNSLEDLKTITSPVYHEVRASNQCNLMCRICTPRDSNLLDREYRTLKIDAGLTAFSRYGGFDRVDLPSLKRLYVAGGEPSVMPQVYEFLEKCIREKTTDFEFSINTNAAKITDRFLKLCSHFSKLNITVSLDGVGLVQEYIRWPSKFDEVVRNVHRFLQEGHRVSFIDVIGIYNVPSFNELLEFQDSEFPGCPVQINFNEQPDDIQSAYNYPNNQEAVESLSRCKQTEVYYNYSRGTGSIVDQLYDHYIKDPQCDVDKMKKFIEFNDKLDNSRKHRLEDYIPQVARAISPYRDNR